MKLIVTEVITLESPQKNRGWENLRVDEDVQHYPVQN